MGTESKKGMSLFHWALVTLGVLGLWSYSITLRRRKNIVTLDKKSMSRQDKIEFIVRNNGADVVVDDSTSNATGEFNGYGNGSVVFDVLRREFIPIVDHQEDGYVIHMFSSADGSSTKIDKDEVGSINGEAVTDELINIKSQFDKMTDEEINQAFDVVRYRLINRKQKLTLGDIMRDLKIDAKRRINLIKKIIPTLKAVKEVNKTVSSGIKNNRRVFRKGTRKDKMKKFKFPNTAEGKRAKKLMREKFNIEAEIKDMLWLLKRKGYDSTIVGNKDTGLRMVTLGDFTGIGISTETTPQQDVNKANDLYLEHRLVRLELIDLGYAKQIAKGNQDYIKGDVTVQERGLGGRKSREEISLTRSQRGKAKDRKSGHENYNPTSLSNLFR